MKDSVKIFLTGCAALSGIAIVCVLSTVIYVEAQWKRSEREIVDIVQSMTNGTPFPTVLARLGAPTSSDTNPDCIRVMGSDKALGLASNSVLHTFPHGSIPMRVILIYTDHQTNAVVFADWKNL